MRCSAAAPARTLAESRLDGAAVNSWEKLEMANKLLRSQAMTALKTPALEHIAASRGSHAHTKPVCLGLASTIRLKGPFQTASLLVGFLPSGAL